MILWNLGFFEVFLKSLFIRLLFFMFCKYYKIWLVFLFCKLLVRVVMVRCLGFEWFNFFIFLRRFLYFLIICILFVELFFLFWFDREVIWVVFFRVFLLLKWLKFGDKIFVFRKIFCNNDWWMFGYIFLRRL